MVKNLYKAVVVMNRETFIERCQAFSLKQARYLIGKRIAKLHRVNDVVVFGYLKEHPDCIKLETEIEFREADDAGEQISAGG